MPDIPAKDGKLVAFDKEFISVWYKKPCHAGGPTNISIYTKYVWMALKKIIW